MTRLLKIRLSILMFLQYFIAGAFTPILSLYLKDYLHFSGTEIGLIFSVTAVGSIVAPVVTSCIADRWIKAEHLFALFNIAAALLMAIFARQMHFRPVILCYFAYTCLSVPTFSLINAIVFHHSPDTRHTFGAIRVWGTIGWIAVAWLFSFLWLRQGGSGITANRFPDALNLAAVSSLVLGLYAFTLPSSRPMKKGERGFIPIESLRVLTKPAIVRLGIFMLSMSLFYRFYFIGTAPFLRSVGFSDTAIMPVMSLGQIPEVFAMGILGWLIVRFGSKKVILIGLSLDIFRYASAALGAPPWLVIAGLTVHGLAYTFIYTTASIYLDRFCDSKSRTGAHQLFTMLTSGMGGFAGNIFCGIILDACTLTNSSVNYHSFWLVPSGGLLLMLLGGASLAGRVVESRRDAAPECSPTDLLPPASNSPEWKK